jgi:acyl-CoA synthetase (AMP-forming)/AMP-acid ligase II
VPRSVEFTGELPRNPSGKVLKRLLRQRTTVTTLPGASQR